MDSGKFVNPLFTKPDYSTKFCRAYYNFLVRHYNKDIFLEVCSEMNMPPEYLLEDGNWVSHEFYLEFLKKIKNKTNNMNIAREVGEALLDTDNINPFEYALLKAMPPFLFYFSFAFEASKVNRRSKYKLTKYTPGKFTFKLQSKETELHDPDICLSAVGFLTSPKLQYEMGFLDVVHTSCIHRGDKECSFQVKYNANRYYFKRVAAFLSFVISSILVFQSARQLPNAANYLFPASSLMAFILLGVTVVLFRNFWGIIKYHTIHYEQNRKKEQLLYEGKVKLDRRYQESYLLRDLSLRLIKIKNSKDVISQALTELEKRFSYNRALVMLTDYSVSKLYTVDVRGFGEHSDMLFKLNFKYPSEKDDPKLFANILEKGECVLIDNIHEFKKNLEPENQMVLMAFGVTSLIVAPIQDSTIKYGILIIGTINMDRVLSLEDKHLIESITRMLALHFQNARNFEKERTLKTLFQKYVPQIVIDGISYLQSGESGDLTPKSNAVSSLFVDLRDFTSMTEAMAPERVVELLNIYIEYVTGYIAKEGGIIDNLVGDGIVAFFPAQNDDRMEYTRKSLKCAIQILGNMDFLNSKMKEKGYPAARLGLGLHCGNATVGNLGSSKKMNYTAIGDTINLASRLEGLTKSYSDKSSSSAEGSLIFTESVLQRAKLDIPKIDLGKITVRGRSEPVRVYMIDKSTASQIDINNLKDLAEQPLLLDEAPERRKKKIA